MDALRRDVVSWVWPTRNLRLVGCLAIGLSGAVRLGPAACCAAQVDFPDPNLSNAVHVALAVPPGPVGRLALLGLTNLVAESQGITNLSGLEWALNLQSLAAAGNAIADLSPLASLTNLTFLDLRWNAVTSLAGLPRVSQPTAFYLAGNALGDVSLVTNVTGLCTLGLDNCGLTNIGALTHLPRLAELDLSRNPLADVTQVSALSNLTALHLSGMRLSTVTFLARSWPLKALALYDNDLRDISPLTALTNLTELNLGHNPVADYASLRSMTNLESLFLGEAALADTNYPSGLPQVKHFSLNGNGLSNTRPLAALTNLQSLSLRVNPLTNLAGLVDLTNLTYLDLAGGQAAGGTGGGLVDLGALQGLVRLCLLSASANRLTNMDALTNAISLQRVDVRTNLLDLNAGSAVLTTIQTLTNRGATVFCQPQSLPPQLALGPWPPSLGLYNSLAIPTNAPSTIALYPWDDVNPGSQLQVNISSSDTNVLANSSWRLVSTNNSFLLTLVPTHGPGTTWLTVTVTDGAGLSTELVFRVDVRVPQLVSIPDPNLEGAMRSALGHPDGNLTSVDLEGLTTLYATRAQITNLSGLHWCSNLTLLDLNQNDLTNLAPLAPLDRLALLLLNHNRLRDLTPLASLTNLSILTVALNQATEIGFMTNLTRLVSVNVSLNRLDLTPGSQALAEVQALTNRGVEVIHLPQRELWFNPGPTNWVVPMNTISKLSLNLWNNGAEDEPLGFVYSSSNSVLLPPSRVTLVPDAHAPATGWFLFVNPMTNGTGTTLLNLTVTNQFEQSASAAIHATVVAPLPLDLPGVGAPGSAWVTWGNAAWFGQTAVTHNGAPAAESGAVNPLEESWLQAQLVGPGRLTFWWRTSSDSDLDWLELDLNGQRACRISGETDWRRQVVNIPPGPTVADWGYLRNANDDNGHPAGWLAQVGFEPGFWLEALGAPSQGQAPLLLHAVPGNLYEVQSSTNLAAWLRVGLVQPTNTDMPFVAADAVGPLRLYRLRDVSIRLDISKRLGAPPAVTVRSPPGLVLELLASTDATNWTSLGVVTNVLGTTTFSNVFGTNYPLRLFRSRLLP